MTLLNICLPVRWDLRGEGMMPCNWIPTHPHILCYFPLWFLYRRRSWGDRWTPDRQELNDFWSGKQGTWQGVLSKQCSRDLTPLPAILRGIPKAIPGGLRQRVEVHEVSGIKFCTYKGHCTYKASLLTSDQSPWPQKAGLIKLLRDSCWWWELRRESHASPGSTQCYPISCPTIGS